MSAEQDVKKYRRLFYLAVVVALAAAGLAWNYKLQMRRGMQVMDVGSFAKTRDQQYPFTVEAYGYKYHGVSGPVVDELVLMFGLYEKDRLFFVRDYLRNATIDGAVAIDVGANTGNHSLFLSRIASKVHAFEPYPPALVKFRKNLELNPEIRNIELHEVGLGDAEAELPFVRPMTNDPGSGSFRLERGQEAGYDTFESKLKVVVGDQWLASRESGPVAVIKIDVEGFEGPVLKGLKQTLAKHRPLVVVEVGFPPVGTIATWEEFVGLFPDGYEFMIFLNYVDGAVRGNYQLRPLTPELFQADWRRDLVAYPRERQSAVPK